MPNGTQGGITGKQSGQWHTWYTTVMDIAVSGSYIRAEPWFRFSYLVSKHRIASNTSYALGSVWRGFSQFHIHWISGWRRNWFRSLRCKRLSRSVRQWYKSSLIWIFLFLNAESLEIANSTMNSVEGMREKWQDVQRKETIFIMPFSLNSMLLAFRATI